MTIDEAIKHCEEVARDKAAEATHYSVHDPESLLCCKCADELRQIAEWLKELKDYRERIPSYEAGYNDAKREIALSGEYERAYERGKVDANKWIPISERLPELNKIVIVTCYGRICTARMISEDGNYGYPVFNLWSGANTVVKETTTHGDFTKGRITAWMPMGSLEPYKAEGEET